MVRCGAENVKDIGPRGGEHFGHALGEAGFEVFVFGFDEGDDGGTDEKLFGGMANQEVTDAVLAFF